MDITRDFLRICVGRGYLTIDNQTLMLKEMRTTEAKIADLERQLALNAEEIQNRRETIKKISWKWQKEKELKKQAEAKLAEVEKKQKNDSRG